MLRAWKLCSDSVPAGNVYMFPAVWYGESQDQADWPTAAAQTWNASNYQDKIGVDYLLVERLSAIFQQNRLYYSTILKLGSYVKDDMLLHIRHRSLLKIQDGRQDDRE